MILRPALSPLLAPCCLQLLSTHKYRVPSLTLLCLCLLSGPDYAELWTILGNMSKLGWVPVRPHQVHTWLHQTIVTAVAKMLQTRLKGFPLSNLYWMGLVERSWALPCQILVETCTQTAPNITITCVSWVIMFIETTSVQFHLLSPKFCLQSSKRKRMKCAELILSFAISGFMDDYCEKLMQEQNIFLDLCC